MMKKTAGLATVLVSVLALSGCGATGAQAPTRNMKQVTDGVEAQSGSIYVRDLLLVAQPDGSAALVGTFINEGTTPDALTGITVNGIKATLSAPSFDLTQNSPVIFSGDSANATGSVAGLNAAAGTRADVVVTFAHSSSVTLSAIVRAKSDYFANVGSQAATPSASPSATK
jgi:PBP1b-binding outer membrane lipoprotein LpoB